MAYSKKVIEHYENPKNVGSFAKEEEHIGVGMVGAPACGDVLKLSIKVEDGVIVDAKFKTYGCLTSLSTIHTPHGSKYINGLKSGNTVYAWNGLEIIEQQVKDIHRRLVPQDELLSVVFLHSNRVISQQVCTREHIYWSKDNKPLEAKELKLGQKVISFEKESAVVDGYWAVADVSPATELELSAAEKEGEFYVVYDVLLEEGGNVFFADGIGSHNCGSAIASSSLVTELVKGKTLDEALDIKNTEIAEELALPPVKIHCSILAEDAIKSAIADYKKKYS